MAAPRRWIRIDVGYDDSAWLEDLTEARGSGIATSLWPRLLCYIGAHGVRGQCKEPSLRKVARAWRIPLEELQALVDAALDHGAIRRDDTGSWVVEKWREYQEPDRTTNKRSKAYRADKSRLSPSRGNDTPTRRDDMATRREPVARDSTSTGTEVTTTPPTPLPDPPNTPEAELPPVGGSVDQQLEPPTAEPQANGKRLPRGSTVTMADLRALMVRECLLGQEAGVQIPGSDQPVGIGLLLNQAVTLVRAGVPIEQLHGAVSVLRQVASANDWPLGPGEPCSLRLLASGEGGEQDWSRLYECIHAWEMATPPAAAVEELVDTAVRSPSAIPRGRPDEEEARRRGMEFIARVKAREEQGAP